MEFQGNYDACFPPVPPNLQEFHSFAYPEPAAQDTMVDLWRELSQYPWDTRASPPSLDFWPYPDQQTASPSVNNDTSPDPEAIVGLDPGVGHTVTQTPADTARKGQKDPANRRALTLEKITRLNELRRVMNMGRTTPMLKVLNAAVTRLGGVIPSEGSGNRTDRIRLAYKELYRVTGNKGRFRHVHCLEKAIKMLQGLPVLDLILE